MKYFYLFVFNILFVSNLTAQIPNAGFENWTDGEPDNWFTNNLAGVLTLVTQSNDARSGSSALKLEMVNFSTVVLGGNATSGNSGTVGFPVSQRHAALNGYYKFLPNAGSTVVSVTVGMLKNGAVIGAGGFATFTPSNSYTSFSAPITYANGEIPDTTYIVLSVLDTTQSPSVAGGYVLIDDLSFGAPTSVDEDKSIPQDFVLEQNYPNPFNPGTMISWQSPVSSHQTLKVYDLLGNEVAVLVDEYRPAGRYKVEFDAAHLSSGIYFYQLSAGTYLETKKMIILK